MLKCTYKIPTLPLDIEIESVENLKLAGRAYRALSSLRREAARVPNQGILIDTLSLQEAQASSEIENIVTTQDEVFRIGKGTSPRLDPRQKEVARHRDSLWVGHEKIIESGGVISLNSIVAMFQALKRHTGGFRCTPGTVLENDFTQDVVYVPPQSEAEIIPLMQNLETFINNDGEDGLDPLIKMALIHHQFESIHPFPDRNGRIGRILNVLFLVKEGLLDTPLLYMSRYITLTKPTYYELLQQVRDTGNWQDWIDYILVGVEATALDTRELLKGINLLFAEYKEEIRGNHKFYTHELLNNLFRHPYTQIEYVVSETGVGRQAAARHLDELVEAGLLSKMKVGRTNYYVNERLVELFIDRPNMLEKRFKRA